jgi:hypothetical protein
MWPPCSPDRLGGIIPSIENLPTKAVETSQVLYDTLGRPRGPRDVSAGGHAVTEGKV